MSPEAMFESLVVSLGTVPVGIVLSTGVLQKQAASLVMAKEAIPKPFASLVAPMETVPESNPERAPDSTSSPTRAVGLMSGPQIPSLAQKDLLSLSLAHGGLLVPNLAMRGLQSRMQTREGSSLRITLGLSVCVFCLSCAP